MLDQHASRPSPTRGTGTGLWPKVVGQSGTARAAPGVGDQTAGHDQTDGAPAVTHASRCGQLTPMSSVVPVSRLRRSVSVAARRGRPATTCVWGR